MPTIIDSLIVELGLNPDDYKRSWKDVEQFDQQAQKKRDTVNKKNDAEQRERARKLKLEEQDRKKSIDGTTGAIANLGRTLIGAVIGFETIKGGLEYLSHMNEALAAKGRTATRLGVDPAALDTWGKAAELAGGKAEDVTATVSELVKEFQQLKTVGGTPGPLLTLLQQFSVPYRDLKGNLLDIGTIFRGLSARVAGLDEQTRSATLARGGIAEGLINLFNESLEKQKEELDIAQKLVIADLARVKAAEDLERVKAEAAGRRDKLGAKIGDFVRPIEQTIIEGSGELSESLVNGTFGRDLGKIISFIFSQKPKSLAAKNNNPGNIKALPGQRSDINGFRIFATAAEGLEAMQGNVERKLKRGNDTISKLITAYEGTDAMKHPADTEAYIARVAKSLGKDRNAKLTAADIPALITAMSAQEAGVSDRQLRAITPNGATPSLPPRTGSNGTGAGGAGGGTVNVRVDQITVNSSRADPAAVADQAADAIQRKVTVAQANAGQS